MLRKINWSLLLRAFGVVAVVIALLVLATGCNGEDEPESTSTSEPTEEITFTQADANYVMQMRGAAIGPYVEGVEDTDLVLIGRNVCKSFGMGIDYGTQIQAFEAYPVQIADMMIRTAVVVICPEYALAIAS